MSEQFKDMPRPLTEEETTEVMKNTNKAIEEDGLWRKLCADCDEEIGGRLARYGKPTPEDLQYCGCPYCGSVGKVKLEYVPPTSVN